MNRLKSSLFLFQRSIFEMDYKYPSVFLRKVHNTLGTIIHLGFDNWFMEIHKLQCCIEKGNSICIWYLLYSKWDSASYDSLCGTKQIEQSSIISIEKKIPENPYNNSWNINSYSRYFFKFWFHLAWGKCLPYSKLLTYRRRVCKATALWFMLYEVCSVETRTR